MTLLKIPAMALRKITIEQTKHIRVSPTYGLRDRMRMSGT